MANTTSRQHQRQSGHTDTPSPCCRDVAGSWGTPTPQEGGIGCAWRRLRGGRSTPHRNVPENNGRWCAVSYEFSVAGSVSNDWPELALKTAHNPRSDTPGTFRCDGNHSPRHLPKPQRHQPVQVVPVIPDTAGVVLPTNTRHRFMHPALQRIRMGADVFRRLPGRQPDRLNRTGLRHLRNLLLSTVRSSSTGFNAWSIACRISRLNTDSMVGCSL